MRMLTVHDLGRSGASATRWFSLELPSWAAPPVGGSASGPRLVRKRGLGRRVLRHIGRHPTGTER